MARKFKLVVVKIKPHCFFEPLVFILCLVVDTALLGSCYSFGKVAPFACVQQQDCNDQRRAAMASSYPEEPPDQLIKMIPELKGLQPAGDQQLSMILDKAGQNVDKLFNNFSDLVATETASETRLDPATGLPLKIQEERVHGQVQPNQYEMLQDQYSYFIGRRGSLVQTLIHEYRKDAEGNEGGPGVKFLSNGFASTLLYFHSWLQKESKFRYLGEQLVGERSAYVVAFAQIPEVATTITTMRKEDGGEVYWLIQGAAWVDKSSFQILQIRTDLLVPQIPSTETEADGRSPNCFGYLSYGNEVRTLVQFGEVQVNRLADSVWLPVEANVNELLDVPALGRSKQAFHNVHHFADYRLADPNHPNIARAKESGGAYKNEIEARPYFELPLKQLLKRAPELKGMSPAPDQRAVAMILQNTGARVDEFLGHLVDVVAHEDISQQRLISRTLSGGMPAGTFQASQHTQDSYLILYRTDGTRWHIEEFRMDAKGNRMDESGTDKGFFITSGFALSSVHFATQFQRDSRFLYLGNQKMGGQDTYVVAFAQIPSQARTPITIQGRDRKVVRMRCQGIAWIDKSTFLILQLRTDLLAPRPEIGLDQQTTKITYSAVRFRDIATPLWLPRDVNVHIQFTDFSNTDQFRTSGDLGSRVTDLAFSNVHHYSNYLRYRVSSRMLQSH
jgi:hypothetical protein